MLGSLITKRLDIIQCTTAYVLQHWTLGVFIVFSSKGSNNMHVRSSEARSLFLIGLLTIEKGMQDWPWVRQYPKMPRVS